MHHFSRNKQSFKINVSWDIMSKACLNGKEYMETVMVYLKVLEILPINIK